LPKAAEAAPESRATFVDVHYRDTLADPIGTVRRIYDAFGFELSDDAERRMRAYMADNQQHKHGQHRYTLEQFSLDAEETRARFATYCERFGVEAE
jgi:Mn-dependent DtxR family transcriptional regulator